MGHAASSANAEERYHTTPLILAVLRGHLRVVLTLLSKGVDVNVKAGYRGATPLHHAAEQGLDRMVQVLLGRGADKDSKDSHGRTPLMDAAYYNRLPVVNTLVTMHANVNVVDARGHTALHFAASAGRNEVVKVLLGAGAERSTFDADGLTPLHVASKVGHLSVVKTLMACVDIHTLSSEGRTPLYVAAENGKNEVVRLLLCGGANVNAGGVDYRTPLVGSIKGSRLGCVNHIRVAETLLAAGADPDIQESEEDCTALHFAVTQPSNAHVSLLLRWGANENIVDAYGDTPSTLNDTAFDIEMDNEQNRGEAERIRLSLARAPADRAWRRRGWLVMVRSRTLKADRVCDPGGSVKRQRFSDSEISGMDLGRLVEQLVDVDIEGLFRNVVSFL